MRKLLALLSLLLCLAPAAAQQFPMTLPANTVYGRLGIGSGPAQAIPFSRLIQALRENTPLNAVSYGADPTGATDSTAAWTAMLTALGAGHCGSIYFPKGKYRFNAALSATLTSTPYSQCAISIEGDGQDLSVLYWPNASGGLTINYANVRNSAHFRNLTFTTGQAGGGTALTLSLSGTDVGVAGSTIQNVAIRGDDGYYVADYWDYGVKILQVSYVQVVNLSVSGMAGHNGIGMLIQGNGPTATAYSVVVDVAQSNFQQLNKGIVYGSYVQGVTVSQSNFTAGNYGIISEAAESGTLEQLAVNSSQFNVTRAGINAATAIVNLQISNNLIFVQDDAGGNTGVEGVFLNGVISGNAFSCGSKVNSPAAIKVLTGSSGLNIVGNSILGCTYGVIVDGPVGSNINVSSNVIGVNAVGVAFGAGSTANLAIGNTWVSNSVDYADAGTANAVLAVTSGLSFDFNKKLLITPANGTGYGLATSQTVTGTAGASEYYSNIINIVDNADFTATGTLGQTGFYLQYNVTGGTGNRAGAYFNTSLSGAVTDANFSLIGVSAAAFSSHDQAGAQMFGANFGAGTTGSNVDIAAVIGIEVNTSLTTGSTAASKIGVNIVQSATDVVSAGTVDAGIRFANQVGAVGWVDGILFDNIVQKPIKDTGTIIRTQGAWTVAGVLDASSLNAATSFFLKGPQSNFTVSGAGAVVAATTIRANSGFSANGTDGASATVSVRKGDGSGACNLVFTFGLYTSTTC